MNVSVFDSKQSDEVIELFVSVFSQAENKNEGALIGVLVSDLITTVDRQDLIGFIARSGKHLVGSIFFSRVTLPTDQSAFILSPVAIATDHQGQGYGQQLIKYGIEYLKSMNVDMVFTYGDPNFYSKVGFNKIDENIAKAPFKLTYPEGWLVQSLNDETIKAIKGSVCCVKALSNPQYW